MTLRLEAPADAAQWCADQRSAGRSIGFVPTMGALHDGHLGLVRRARAENSVACVSVFVNPLQFNDAADFARYPRDFAGDACLLDASGCDMVFTGTLAGFFPRELRADGALDPRHLEDPGPPAEGLEGAFRPGHFAGVATIVRRLFEVTRPTRAYFGQKDYQQTRVVRHLVERLGFPELVVCPTAREDSGLARSSRNELLTADERRRAVVIVNALRAAREAWRRGERDAGRLRAEILAVLATERFGVEYAALRDPIAFGASEPAGNLRRAVALVAGRMGRVRLIDNLILDEDRADGDGAP